MSSPQFIEPVYKSVPARSPSKFSSIRAVYSFVAISTIAQLFSPATDGIFGHSSLRAQEPKSPASAYYMPGPRDSSAVRGVSLSDSAVTKVSLPDSTVAGDIRLNIQKIKHDVNAVTIRGFCSDEMALLILASGDAPAYVERIREAVVKITEASGEHHRYWAIRPLYTSDMRMLFIQNLDAFVKITQATGVSSSRTFYALSNLPPKFFTQYINALVKLAQMTDEHAPVAVNTLCNFCISDLFVQNKEQIIDAFAKIAQATDENVYTSFDALLDPDISRLFIQNPDAFVQIAQAAGGRTPDVFYILGAMDPNLFIQNHDAFVRIAQATGEWAEEAFDALRVPKVAALFAQDAARFVQIAENNGKNTGHAFLALAK